ncbi:MAG: recombination mediator RecR [Oscillospiraceae bacterium]|nr:recombination mediator RecR [Oscillospiraceae bacterium]
MPDPLFSLRHPALHMAPPLAALVEQLQSLPGIGHKSAQRMAYHLLHLPDDAAAAFIHAVEDARARVHECPVCHNLTDGERCPACLDDSRDAGLLCVVEDPRDVLAIERTREFAGRYHVLHGTLSPIDGIGPEQLRIKSLLTRVANEEIREIILATNPTVEGEATAMYLVKLLTPFGVKVTRLAYGIPVGGDLEYADEVTLRRSLEGRHEIGD